MLFIFLAIAGLLFVAYTQRQAVQAQLDAFKLLPEPETFTELYVNNFTQLSGTLPKNIKAGESMSFSFTVHNVEGKTVVYPYVISIVDDAGSTTTIASSSVTLESGQSAVVPVEYVFRSSQRRVSVVITLSNLDQSIHFFIPTNNYGTDTKEDYGTSTLLQ